MGLVAADVPRASCITAEAASVVSATHSVFESNFGGYVVFARTNAEIDLAHANAASLIRCSLWLLDRRADAAVQANSVACYGYGK